MINYFRKLFKLIPQSLLVLIYSYITLIILFIIWRLLFAIYFYDDLSFLDIFYYLKSFLIGARIDLIVSSYLLLPILLTIYIPYIGWNSKFYRKLLLTYLSILYFSISIFYSINIEWFNEIGNHINMMIITYTKSDEGWKMVFEAYNVLIYLLVCSLIAWFMFFILKSLTSSEDKHTSWKINLISFMVSFISLGILIRGGTQERPLGWGYAHFSDNNMANSIAQNPIFFFSRSYIELKEEEKYKTKFLKVENIESVDNIYNKLRSANQIDGINIDLKLNDKQKPNIVLMILETFVSENCNFLNSNQTQNITPFLNELSNKGISFSNCFANGTRSAFGISTILTSWPVLPGKPLMYQVESAFPNNAMHEIMSIFSDLGYKRTFLYGGDSSFDNLKGFCFENGYDQVIDWNDSRFKNAHGNMWGYYDHFVIDEIIDIADSHKNEPFMITFFSTTNHNPFKIPEEYEEKLAHIFPGKKHYERAAKTMAYNDLIIKEFFDEIKDKEWYENTIFIFTADHGSTIHRDIPVHPRNGHIPFIIYSDLLDKSYSIDKIVSQTDIIPTIIDLIGEDHYLSNFYGISGLKGGGGYACRILNDDFQWITPNNIYYELIGTDNRRHFIFDSIWDQKYKEINSDQILELQSQSNAYIKNAYYQFKEQNNAQKTTIDD